MTLRSTDVHFIESVILVACLLAILITVYAVFIRRKDFTRDNVAKWLLLITFMVISPLVYIMNFGLAVEETKPVSFCNSCHVMEGYVEDLENPDSDRLAAIHYQSRWISKDQCYNCHTNYGLQGTIKAKMAGIRHIWKYYIVGYDTPVEFNGTYNNQICLNCHEPVKYYQDVAEHQENRADIESSKMSCLGLQCHVRPHPKDAWRTTKNEQ